MTSVLFGIGVHIKIIHFLIYEYNMIMYMHIIICINVSHMNIY